MWIIVIQAKGICPCSSAEILEDALMELLTNVRSVEREVPLSKKIMRTFVQTCNNCDHMRQWDSQPFINNIPAGNILLSASILFGGGLPSQVIACVHTQMHTISNAVMTYCKY